MQEEKSQADIVFQRYVYILENMPLALADLILDGEEKAAQAAMVNWGHGKKPVTEIWQEIKREKEK